MGLAGRSETGAAPLSAVLALSALASMGTGVFWHGVPFIMTEEFGYQRGGTLALALACGAVYVAGASLAGRALRRLERRASARSVLGTVLLGLGGLTSVPAFIESDVAVWVTAMLVSVLSSLLWPTIESYTSAGRHGQAMRRAIGVWNITWASCVVLAMLAIAPFLVTMPRGAFGLVALCNLLALVPLFRLPTSPAPHDSQERTRHVLPEYPALLRGARVLLMISYLVTAAMSPLLPFLVASVGITRLRILGAEFSAQTPLVATWMLARVLAMAALWRTAFWHGRWGTLLAGGAAMGAGFAVIVASWGVWTMALGFLTLGAGLGVIYYAALYYAMSVGSASVDAGGTHEALIGAGYALGPGVSLLGLGLGRSTSLRDETATIALVWLVLLAGGVTIVRWYRRARSQHPARGPDRAS
ncbi:MAG: hypothetical protein H6811_11705 [Phycisphaeraceae bacterium]|nr:hypothetical protein [Phycisphaeraceae bacterium]